MKELNNLMLQFLFLIILIIILIMMKEYPNINKTDIMKAFQKI